MTRSIYSWRVKGNRRDIAERLPRWKMTEEEAAEWGRRWGVELEKIAGSEEQREAPRKRDQD